LYCLSLDLQLLITSLVFFLLYHCIVCPSIYSFWLPLWYFFFNTIVLSVPRYTASDYLFDPFSLISLYCLSLDLRLLITTLVLLLYYHCIVYPSIYASDYLFGTFSFIPLYDLSLDLRLLITSLILFLLYHCIVCPSIYGFWLPLWYFFFNTIVLSVPRFTASDYLFGTFSLIPLYCLPLELRLLITSLVLFFNTIVLSVPRLTASDYLFGTFSLIPLYYLSLDLRLLITSLILFL
jgi:hypothetical protein